MAAPTIPTGPLEHPILDYAALQRQGISELERLAGGQWTDFNAHDPGITLLETLCYALTDLGYRTFHPIPDLLAEAEKQGPLCLFTPAEVLTSRAVSSDDLRRIALDVPGVKNAWVVKSEDPSPRLRYDPAARTLSIDTGQTPAPNTRPVAPRGLWRVLIEKSDLEDIDSATLRRSVAVRLNANRPLCEDFDDIVVLDPMPVAVTASVEIGETENGETVLLGILEQVSALISPIIGFMTFDQAMAAGWSTEQAFEGPALDRGFIDPATLSAAQRRLAIHTSDVIHTIMSVPGVRAVRTIGLARAGAKTGETWSLTLDQSGAAFLDLNASLITLFKDRMPVAVDRASVAKSYAERALKAHLFPSLPRARRDLLTAVGRARDVTAYLPLQADLPRLYGLGAGALPDSSGTVRQAQANQLRGYLALLDQFLANEHAQLGAFALLFSAADGPSRSYFGQLVDTDDQDLPPVVASGFDQATLNDRLESEQEGTGWRRRNRFLNHLLAQFAESITDDPQATNAVESADSNSLTRLLDAKRQFLVRIPQLGSARSTGVDLLSAEQPSNKPPAIAERVRLRLGLSNDAANRFLVVEHILLRALPGDAANMSLPLLAAASRPDPWSLQLSFVFPAALDKLETMIQRVIREETPAHLVAYLVWLKPDPFAAFAAAHDDWLTALRNQRLDDGLGSQDAIQTSGGTP